MNRIIAALCGLLALTATVRAQALTSTFDGTTTTVVVQCPGDQRATLCGPVVQIMDASSGEYDAAVLFAAPMTDNYSGIQAALPDVLAASSECIACTPEQAAAGLRSVSGQSLLSTYGQRVEEARMLLRSHPEVRSATAVVDAWTAANTAPSDILPPAVVIAVRRVHAEMRAAAAAAEAAANGGGE